MTKRKTDRQAATRGGWRRAGVWIAALGLLGAASQASAIVRLERFALEARVQSLRDQMHVPAGAADAAAPGGTRIAQIPPWANWNNWSNWNNWPNWGNWGNWLNR